METKETQTDKEVKSQTENIKLEEARSQRTKTDEYREYIEIGKKGVRKVLIYSAPIRIQILSELLSEATQTVKEANVLKGLKDDVARIVDGLDARTKAILGVVEEIGQATGVSCGVDWGDDLLYKFRDDELIRNALNSIPDAAEHDTLKGAYELASAINEREN